MLVLYILHVHVHTPAHREFESICFSLHGLEHRGNANPEENVWGRVREGGEGCVCASGCGLLLGY